MKNHQVELTTEPEQIEAGKPSLLKLKMKNNAPVSLDVSHERKVHLITVNEDLDWFRHMHPKEQLDGSFTVEANFPEGGKYFLFVDYKPKKSKPTVDKLELNVDGKSANEKEPSSEKFESNIDGYKILLENGNDFQTNRNQALKLSIERGGSKISANDLDQYLGANAHIVMIRKSDKEYLHIHPMTNAYFPIYAETFIEKPGIYKVWVQFQINGKVHTADLTVNVEQSKKGTSDKHSHKHH